MCFVDARCTIAENEWSAVSLVASLSALMVDYVGYNTDNVEGEELTFETETEIRFEN